MPITSTARKAGPFLCNGSQTAFPFAFKVFETTDVRVVLTNATGIESDVAATVALNSDQDTNPGGTVTVPTAYASGNKITIASNIPQTQEAEFVNQGGFYPELLNEGLDRAVALIQQVDDKTARSIKLPVSAAEGDYTLPVPQGNQLLAWNSDGSGVINLNPGDLVSVATYGNTRADIFDGDGTDTTFTLSGSPGSANNLAISIDGVVQVPGVDYVWGGSTALIFTVAPPNGTKIFVRYQEALDENPDVSGKLDVAGTNVGASAPTLRENIGVPSKSETLVRVASITALRAVASWPGGRPTRIQTDISWAAGDGGGTFRWDAASTATDNNGTTIKETAVATGRWIRENPAGNTVQVEWFGAIDGTLDYLAWQRAIDSIPLPFLGSTVVAGQPFYNFLGTVVLRSGIRLLGQGKGGWEPYIGTGSPFPSSARTVIQVDGILAFDAANTNTARIEGLVIRGKDGRQSNYATAPGFDVGSAGIDITASSQFEAHDFALQGLANGIQCNLTGVNTEETITKMPSFTFWQASDVGCVFRFGTPSSTYYTVRDPLIGESLIALHCGRVVEAHWPDGLRLAGLRLFQCDDLQVYIRRGVYVSIVDVTMFESRNENMVLVECETVTLAGCIFSRNGSYFARPGGVGPFPQKTAIRIANTSNIKFQGVIRQGTGAAFELDTCIGVNINAAIDSPFWTSGSDTMGVVQVRNSQNVHIEGAFTTTDNRGPNPTNFRYAVDADEFSSRTLTGSITTTDEAGTIRAAQLQKVGGYEFVLKEDLVLGPSGVSGAIGGINVWLNAGKELRSRCVQIDHPTVQLRIVINTTLEGVFWTPTADARGTTSVEDLPMYANGAGPSGFKSVALTLRNTTGVETTVPAGTRIRISTAVV